MSWKGRGVLGGLGLGPRACLEESSERRSSRGLGGSRVGWRESWRVICGEPEDLEAVLGGQGPGRALGFKVGFRMAVHRVRGSHGGSNKQRKSDRKGEMGVQEGSGRSEIHHAMGHGM